MKSALNRIVLVCAALAAACGGKEPQIQVFTAAPASIAYGSKATLVFSSATEETTLSVDHGVGDVTGKSSVEVSPSDTTTYTLTATRGDKVVTSSTTVTVTATPAVSFKVEPQSAFVAGQPVTVKVTAASGAGATLFGYQGTVQLTSDDASAVLPPDVSFTAADKGVKTASVTLKAAGAHLVLATDKAQSSTKGVASVSVAASSATALELAGVPTSVAAGQSVTAVITAKDAYGNVAAGYRGTVTVSTTDAAATVAPAHAFSADDAGRALFPLSFATAKSGVIVSAHDSASLTVSAPAVTVGHAAAAVLRVVDFVSEATADDVITFTVRVEDRFGNKATGYTGAVHVVLTDLSAPAIPDLVFTAADAGEKSVSVAFYAEGPQSVVLSDASRTTSAELKVKNTGAFAYVLNDLGATSIAGHGLPLVITAVDRHGNVARDYTGIAHVSSADATDLLPADGTFTAGVRTVAVSFLSAGDHAVTASEVGGTITATSNTVTVSPSDATALALSTTSASVTAGVPLDVTVRAQDLYGNTVKGFAGAVHFVSDDTNAVLPADYTYVAGDEGSHTFAATLKTAGYERISAQSGAIGGIATWSVSHAAAALCDVSGVPATTTAGTQLALRVRVTDNFANVATSYAGTIALTATDSRAALAPASATYVPAVDAGSHAFGAKLLTTGAQTITAADSAASITCSANVSVDPAALHIALTVPADPMAGSAQTAGVALVDAFDNAVSSTGTVNLTTTDAAAVIPASVTLAGGTATASITFRTVGSATVNAVLSGTSSVTGAAPVTVHGLVYTDPAIGLGKVRVVKNATSRGDFVQLDVVSNTRLLTSGAAATRRNGAYSIAMNLPVSAGKIAMDATPYVAGTVLSVGTGAVAQGAFLSTTGPAANVLLSGASQKMTGTGAVTGDANVSLNQVFYSVRVKIAAGATVGTVFDGNALPVAFKASVRDRSGVDTIRLEDFALGKLEIR